jgi:hypothetical protein
MASPARHLSSGDSRTSLWIREDFLLYMFDYWDNSQSTEKGPYFPLENREYGRVGICCADHVTHLYQQKLALTSPTSGGRSLANSGHGDFFSTLFRIRPWCWVIPRILIRAFSFIEGKFCTCTLIGKITNKAEANQIQMTTAKLQPMFLAILLRSRLAKFSPREL